VTKLVGNGSGNFRYDSNTTVSNFSKSLGQGVSVIYREQPTVTIGVDSLNKTYDGVSYVSSASNVTYAGFVNGDGTSSLTGALAFGGSAQSQRNVGNYIITASGLTSAIGYNVVYSNSSLVITPKLVTLSIGSVSKTYDSTTNYNVTSVNLTSLSLQLGIAGDSVASANVSYTSATPGLGVKTITLNRVVIDDGNNGANYLVTLVGNSNSSIVSNNIVPTNQIINNIVTPAADPSRISIVTSSAAGQFGLASVEDDQPQICSSDDQNSDCSCDEFAEHLFICSSSEVKHEKQQNESLIDFQKLSEISIGYENEFNLK
jgi:hypothetical protein